MTLAIGWPNEVGENLGTWPHEGGDWHSSPTRRAFPLKPPKGRALSVQASRPETDIATLSRRSR